MSAEDNRLFPLNLPPVDLKFIREEGMVKVYDRLRKKFVAVTPEEIVRQHFVEWLIKEFHYPESHIANEVSLSFNGMQRRADTLACGRDGKPLLVVEYKAPQIKITQNVFDQIARYNAVFKAKYIAVSNGVNHYCCVMASDGKSYNFLPQIPDYRGISFGFSEN